MSNYYKKGYALTTISYGTVAVGQISPYFNVNGLTSVNKIFINSVDETVLPLGYTINGTDISQWCIAKYVESSGSTTYTSIPGWCTKIRAVLVGGGGNGGQGTAGSIQTTPLVQTNTPAYQYNSNEKCNYFVYQVNNTNNGDSYGFGCTYYDDKNGNSGDYPQGNPIYEGLVNNLSQIFSFNYTNSRLSTNTTDYNLEVYMRLDSGYQQHRVNFNGHLNHSNTNTAAVNINTTTNTQQTGNGGAGGGGGGFLYLNSTNVKALTVSVQAGGSAQDSTLTIGNSVYTAKAGSSASTNTAGAGGVIGNGTVNLAGEAGSTTSTSTGGAGGISGVNTYTQSLSYGKGGNGGNGSGGGEGAISGYNGQNGYYRIYFLID